MQTPATIDPTSAVEAGVTAAAAPGRARPPGRRRGWSLSPFWTMVIVSTIALCLPINQGDLRHDAPTYAWMAKRVAATGDWLHLYYDWDGALPYYNKPPLQFWITAVVYKILGVSVAAARIVPALLWLAAGGVLYRIVRTGYSRALAATAVLLLCLQREIIGNVMEVRLEGGMVLGQLLATAGVLRLLSSPPGTAPRRIALFALIGFGCGLGLMIKGGATLLCLAVFLAASVWSRRWDLLRDWRGMLALTGVAALVAGPWFVGQYWIWGGGFVDGLRKDAVEQQIRFDNHPLHVFLFYYIRRVPESFWYTLAFALIGARTLWTRGKRRSAGHANLARPLEKLVVCWIVVVFVLIHFSSLRTIRYAIPMYPWLALLSAIGLFAWARSARVWRRVGLKIAAPIAVIFAAAVLTFGIPISRVSTPELARTSAAVAARIPKGAATLPYPSPMIHVLASNKAFKDQDRCALQFYTDVRVAQLAPDAMARVSPGDFVVLLHGDAQYNKLLARLTADLPSALPLDDGRRYRIFLVADERR